MRAFVGTGDCVFIGTTELARVRGSVEIGFVCGWIKGWVRFPRASLTPAEPAPKVFAKYEEGRTQLPRAQMLLILEKSPTVPAEPKRASAPGVASLGTPIPTRVSEAALFQQAVNVSPGFR